MDKNKKILENLKKFPVCAQVENIRRFEISHGFYVAFAGLPNAVCDLVSRSVHVVQQFVNALRIAEQ